RLVDRLVQTEAVRDLLVGRVPKDDVPTADHYRHILDRHPKPIEQLLDVRITIEVDEGVWMPVARQEFFDAEGTGRVQRADEYRVAKPPCDEFVPSQNERAHQDLAEFGVGLHEGKQLRACELEDLRRLGRQDSNRRTLSRQHAGLARELPRDERG